MVTQCCQQWLRRWNAAASYTVRDGEDLLDGHELACVRSQGGETAQTTAAGQQAMQDPGLFSSSLEPTPLSCLIGDIIQLIMTRKIIATQMMKTLDLWPERDLQPTSVVRRENLLPNQCFPFLLCGLRKAWKQADFCSLDSGWERQAVVTTEICPIWGRYEAGGMNWVRGSLCVDVSLQTGIGQADQSGYRRRDRATMS